MYASGACRFSTIGARRWLPIQARSGWVWSISATKATICGPWRTEQFLDFAGGELEKIGLIERKDVIGGTLVRVPSAYPAYFGAYSQFGDLRNYLDRFSNLYPIGRNGMHRYNNQDHSMLTANAAVDAITEKAPKQEIWNVNAEESYHEESRAADEVRHASARS